MRSTHTTPKKRNYVLLAIAILIGLSWVGYIYLTMLLTPFYTFSGDENQNIGIWRLIVGVFIYVLLLPLLIKSFFRKDSLAKIIGFTLPRHKAAYVFAAAVILLPPLVTYLIYGTVGHLAKDYSTLPGTSIALAPHW